MHAPVATDKRCVIDRIRFLTGRIRSITLASPVNVSEEDKCQYERNQMQLKKDPKFDEFFNGVPDEVTKGKITARVARLMFGNPGKSEGVGDGVVEMKIDYGPGWRVYYVKVGDQIIILLGGGSKKQQQSDIDAAKERAKQYKKK